MTPIRFSSPVRPPTPEFGPGIFGMLALLLALLSLSGCAPAEDEGDSGSDGGDVGSEEPPPASDLLEIDFARAAYQAVGEDFGDCDRGASVRLRFGTDAGTQASSDVSFSLRDETGALSWTVRPFGQTRVDPGTELCMNATLRDFEPRSDGVDQCLLIQDVTDALAFSARLSIGMCVVDVTAPIVVRRFDTADFCTFACQGNADCGRVLEDCYDGCVRDLTASTVEDAPVCHDATRNAIRCMYRAPCAGLTPERVCESELRNVAFDAPDCRPPPIPFPPAANPDPLRCDPEPGDLVSGSLGDFAIISRTRDDAAAYYLILDLTQLSEIEATIAENPGSPSLELAETVARDLRLADQTSLDACERPELLAIRFAPPFTPNFGSLDVKLVQLQVALDDLVVLAGEVKKEATEAFMELVFCPVTGDIVGDEIPGLLVQGALGCL